MAFLQNLRTLGSGLKTKAGMGLAGGLFGFAGGVGRRGLGGWAARNTGTVGAMTGGLYGALSDDTSIAKGALIGAGLGRYGRTGLMAGRVGWNRAGAAGVTGGFRLLSAARVGARGMWKHAFADAQRSGRYIASNYTRPYNAIRGLWR